MAIGFPYSASYDNGITVRIRNLPDGPSLFWMLNFAAPGNAQIQPGQYRGAERFPFQDSVNPWLAFSGQGCGCNTLTGSFDIYEVEYDGDGVVTRWVRVSSNTAQVRHLHCMVRLSLIPFHLWAQQQLVWLLIKLVVKIVLPASVSSKSWMRIL